MLPWKKLAFVHGGMVLFGNALLGHACSGRRHLLMGRCIPPDMLAEQNRNNENRWDLSILQTPKRRRPVKVQELRPKHE